MDEEIESIPRFGWTIRMDHEFPQKRVQKAAATFKQTLRMIPLVLRYFVYYVVLWFRNKKPVMDFIKLKQININRGAPIGGIGCGSIGRSCYGDFCHFQMIPGLYEDEILVADQFIVTIMNENKELIYQKVLCVKNKKPNVLKSWDWDFPGEDGEYTALYPRAWYVYNIKKHNVKLICRQISPVIPHNYKDSSIPGAVFVWKVVNNNSFNVSVSLTFTFKNGTGSSSDCCGGVSSENLDITDTDKAISGVCIKQKIGGVSGSYLIGCTKTNNNITRCSYFDPKGSGYTIWSELTKEGHLENSEHVATGCNKELAVAVCSQFMVSSNSSENTEFCLVWNFPFAKFPLKEDQHLKYYTKYFGDSDLTGQKIMKYCLQNYNVWEKSICEWQKPILDNNILPIWYKHALFNELYYISDGGTLWLLPFETDKFQEDDPRKEMGHFAYLEGHEYRMYTSYDVHFYASFALSMLWPKIQHSLQYDIRDTVDAEIKSKVWYLASGKCTERKKKGTVPHDVGDPEEDPFFLINSYPIHDVSQWRDLNIKFVLQVYRDYKLQKNDNYIKDMFPQIKTLMEKTLMFDKDNDGMIENSGTADQTYDSWVMTGTSAYCGSLWLAALHATVQISQALGDTDSCLKYADILKKGLEAFDKKLWNGKYYNFDCSPDKNHASIMSDQLCGIWYLKCLEPELNLLPESKVNSALMTIYENNVMKYFDGGQGAVNGMMEDGQIDRYSVQSEEMWTGVTYSLSSLLISQGMIKEGFKTAEGLVNTIYNLSSLAFSSPEALHGLNEFRSLCYMRPLSIWSIQLALDNIHEKLQEN